MATSSATSTSINNNDGEKRIIEEEEMQVDSFPTASGSSGLTGPLRVPSPMITVTEAASESSGPSVTLTPTRNRKVSPATTGASPSPRQRKRSQPVRGDLLPDPDKLLSYKHHDKREDEPLEDPTVPGGQPKPPPEPRQPRQPGEVAERKRSTVTFCPVVETIEK